VINLDVDHGTQRSVEHQHQQRDVREVSVIEWGADCGRCTMRVQGLYISRRTEA
jgi:hypothetical protein